MALRIIRWSLTVSAAALWGETLTIALDDTHIKIFLTVAMATFLVSVAAAAAWMIRSDHLGLALARNKIREIRLAEALREEADARRNERRIGHLNHVL
ncbi:hypothetical protein AB0395_28770 [Streptosporangium sp. NPDC051023]|uniref:hypothetical protein n=1 Tax=Streptosporangium sp. NPDC051023 TaxID=3155410 RepID=UPI00344B492C